MPMGKGEGEGGGGGGGGGGGEHGGERRRKRKHHRSHHSSHHGHGSKRRHKHRRHREDERSSGRHAGRGSDQQGKSRSPSPSHSSGSSGSDQGAAAGQQLGIEELRGSVTSQVGEILTHHPEMETFLVKIVEHLGKGKKVDVQSVENPSLKSKLINLFLSFRSSHKVTASNGNQVFRSASGSGSDRGDGVGVLDLVTQAIQRHLERRGKGDEAKQQQAQEEERARKGPKRAIGPTMPIGPIGPAPAPPQPQLQASIGPQLPPSAQEKKFLEELNEEEGEDDFVGPVQVVSGGASLKSAQEEIDRILKCSAAGANSYQVLGVDPSVVTKDVVKRYLKLSLLIHPDKCKGPSAQDAFSILNKAKEELRDQSKREELDDKLDDERLWDLAVSEAKRRQQAADWQSIRQTGHVAKEKGPMQREEWMTTPGTGPARPQVPTKNVTRFSR